MFINIVLFCGFTLLEIRKVCFFVKNRLFLKLKQMVNTIKILIMTNNMINNLTNNLINNLTNILINNLINILINNLINNLTITQIINLINSLTNNLINNLTIVLYCIMRPYTDGPIGPLSYRHSSGVVRNPHSTLAE